MNKLPMTPTEIEAWQAEMAVQEAALRDLVKHHMPEMQLDCLLAAYVSAADHHGVLVECGQALIEIGGRLLFKQLGLQPAAACAVPASGQPLQHPMPSTVQ